MTDSDANPAGILPHQWPRRRLVYVFLVWLLIAVPIFWWVLRSTQAARAVGHAFLNALDKGDSSRAFALCSPKLQRKIGKDRDLQVLVERSHGLYCPTFWTLAQIQGDVVELKSVKNQNMRDESFVQLRLTKSGGKWQVTSMNSRTPEGNLRLSETGQ